MKNKIIDSCFLSHKKEDILEDKSNTNLLLHLVSSMILGIQLLN